MVFPVEATVDQCLAVGTTYTYQIMQIQNMTSRSRLGSTYQYPPGQHGTFLTVMSSSLLQITRYLDSDSSDDKPTKKNVRIIVKMQSSIGWQIQNPTS